MVCGAGGVGKGTLVAELVRRVPNLWLSRSWTTRARREGEPPDAYVFVDRAAFEGRVEAGGFYEWAEFLGNLYGTPLPEPPAGDDVVLEIDIQGARQVAERDPEAVIVLLVPPSREEQARRLRGRGDDPAAAERRLTIAAEEEAEGRRLAHHVVVNDDLDRAVDEVAAIVAAARAGAP